MKKLRKLGKRNSILLILFILVIIFVLIFYWWNNFSVLGREQVYTSFIISETLGFDLNPEALTFGKIGPGQSAKRDLQIENNFDRKARVDIRVKGEVKDYLTVSENDFFLEAGERKNISFAVYTPKDIPKGKYEGVINIFLKKF
jgi:hypothetical protein